MGLVPVVAADAGAVIGAVGFNRAAVHDEIAALMP